MILYEIFTARRVTVQKIRKRRLTWFGHMTKRKETALHCHIECERSQGRQPIRASLKGILWTCLLTPITLTPSLSFDLWPSKFSIWMEIWPKFCICRSLRSRSLSREKPKASMGVGYGDGCAPPQPTWGPGVASWAPQRGAGKVLAANDVWHVLSTI